MSQTSCSPQSCLIPQLLVQRRSRSAQILLSQPTSTTNINGSRIRAGVERRVGACSAAWRTACGGGEERGGRTEYLSPPAVHGHARTHHQTPHPSGAICRCALLPALLRLTPADSHPHPLRTDHHHHPGPAACDAPTRCACGSAHRAPQRSSAQQETRASTTTTTTASTTTGAQPVRRMRRSQCAPSKWPIPQTGQCCDFRRRPRPRRPRQPQPCRHPRQHLWRLLTSSSFSRRPA